MKILRRFCKSILLLGCLSSVATALPEGPGVRAGSVNIHTNGNTQTIQQLTDRAIINWNGFNIDVGELVHFIQPSSISAILNRVVGQDPSLILGALQANGQVFLVNPNGVLFGQSAQVDVGSLVVSTLNITDQDFMQGTLRFEQDPSKELAAVINRGTLKIDSNGFLVLTGPMVANEGLILARVGQVALAAGTKSTVSFDPTGMIQLELPTDSQTSAGIVSLSQADAGDLLSSVVRSPQAQAGEIVVRDGRTFLEVESGTLVNTGIIEAEGLSGLDGGRVVLNSNSHTILAEGSLVSAAGQGEDSSGGEVYVLSQGSAVSEFGSSIDVSAGQSGNGGFAEQSSRSGFVGTSVDLGAPGGETGTFLIDPERILVQTGEGGGVAPTDIVFVPEATIEAFSQGGFLLQTDDGVDFEALEGGALTLQNGVDLTIDLVNAGGDGGPAMSFANPGDRIVLSGDGAFSLDSVTGTEVRDLQVVTDDGNITLNLNGAPLTGSSQFSTSNGVVNADVGGELRLNSDILMILGDITADSVVGRGREFFVGGEVSAETIDILAATTIGGFVEGGLTADTIILEAANIGPGSPVNFVATNLDVTANRINMNSFGELQNLTVTNLNVVNPEVSILNFGEGVLLVDSGEVIEADSPNLNYVYTISGDRALDNISAQSFTLTTSGAPSNNITGLVFEVVGDLNLTADAIDIQTDSLGIGGLLTATSTVGNIIVRADDNNALNVNLDSAGSVFINDIFAASPSSVSGSVNGDTVDVVGTEIDLDLGGRVQDVSVRALSGSAELRGNSPNIHISGSAFGENAEIVLENQGGDISLGFLSASIIELVALGDIAPPSDLPEASGASAGTLRLSADNITANVFADVVIAEATGDIALVTQQLFPMELTATSSNGEVDVRMNGTTGSPPREGDPPPPESGDLLSNQIEGNNVRLEVNGGSILLNSGQIVADNVILIADSIEADLLAQSVDAQAFGDITLTGDSPNLLVSADSTEGNIVVSNAGNIATGAISGFAVLLSNAEIGGDITHNSSLIDAFSVTLLADNITAVTDTLLLVAESPGDITINNLSHTLEKVDIIAGMTADLTTPGIAVLNTFQGEDLVLDVGQAVTGSLSANSIDVTGTEINLDVTANQVIATARSGDVVLTGSNESLAVTATADTGDISVTNSGNIVHNEISGLAVSLTAQGGNISTGSGRITAPTVTLSADNVVAQTATGTLSVNSSGNVTIDNLAADLNSFNLETTGNINLTSSGNINQANLSGGSQVQATAGGRLEGSFSGSNLSLAGQSVEADIAAQSVTGNASLGDLAMSSSGSGKLTVTNSSAPNGNFTLTHQGDVEFDSIQAENVTIDTTGNITDTSNTIIASGITLNGNNVLVNTQGQIIVINAQGNVVVSNSLVNVNSLTIDAQGNVSFGTDGDLTIDQIAGGQNVELQVGGNILANPNAFVNGTNLKLSAGGSITPNLSAPLQLGAGSSISVQAQGASIAAALQGSLPASAISINSPSGPIFYNGQLLNGAPPPPVPEIPEIPQIPDIPVIPPVLPPVEDAINQIGQQTGLTVDDGSVGSAANDGLVEQSPTQKLVAKLTEAAGGSGGEGLSTEVLITLEVDQLGEVQLTLSEPSPLDKVIDESENLTADDLLDLDSEELGDVKVSLYYDPVNDRLVMAVNLTADDIIDLDIADFQEIPVNINYSFLSDPAILLEALRANDIIDLEVEDLGLIPIEVHVGGDPEHSATDDPSKIQDETNQGETE